MYAPSSPPSIVTAWPVDDDDDDAFSPTTDMYTYAHTPVSSTTAPSVTSSASVSASSPGSFHAGSHSDDNESATIALRRQRNRESMRRTRLRAKETLTALRSTLAHFETQYARLLAPPATTAVGTNATYALGHHRAFVERLQARLLALVQIRRALEHENGAVRMQIEQRQALERELQQIVNDNELDEMINEKLALLGGSPGSHDDASSSSSDRTASRHGFTPLSPTQAHAMIVSFCNELARVRAAAAATAGSAPAPLEVFGWRTRRHVDATTNEMHFEFTKQFDHVTAIEMTHRAWTQAMDVTTYRENERELDIRRLEFLQHVSNDVKLMLRETVHVHDDTVFRTHFLIFKMPILHGDSFLVGMRSLNPPPPLTSEPEPESVSSSTSSSTSTPSPPRVVWIDVSVCVELVACGPRGCIVSWRGRTNYHSPTYAAENAIKFLMGVLRWEQAILGPLITLF